MSKIRILCTADLHLGRESATTHPTPSIDLTAAGAWKRIVDLAILQEADAVVIAGDVFDGAGAYVETRQVFLEGLRLLGDQSIPVIAVTGNHDWNTLPMAARSAGKNFYLLGKNGSWETLTLETRNGAVAFVGWSFGAEQVSQSQVAFLKRHEADMTVVGIVHGDTTPKSPYHPITVSELTNLADAWVVGHIHKPASFDGNVIYTGSPQALDFGPGERGRHGVRWLEVEGGIAKFSDLVPISSVRFESVELEVEVGPGREALDCVWEALQGHCIELCEEQTFESIQIRADVTFTSIEKLPKLDDLATQILLETHGATIVTCRLKSKVDPWSLKDLRTQTGEAARLLIGAQALDSAEEGGANEVPAGWIEAAKRLVTQGAKDVELQYQRTLSSVLDKGEAALTPPTDEERLTISKRLLIEELESILQGVAN